MNTHLEGVKGENAAVKFLIKNRYKIVERNYKCHYGEIDIIAARGGFIVFVEVKSRSGDKFGLPREAVTVYKQQRIVSAAQYWLFKNKCTGLPIRFDVVEILNGNVTVIADAFRP